MTYCLVAFSHFSLCEYIIAYTNMGYHYTASIDFKSYKWMVVKPAIADTTSNGSVVNDDDTGGAGLCLDGTWDHGHAITRKRNQ